ncbi:MAG: hypothetical protein J6Y90_04710 [Lachnospiraceae bacterium]|nr:hypothetical protein [Lachnospiraceae bacterium]
MRRKISFKEYRTIDLVLFALIMCVSEVMLVVAATTWFADQLYTVSIVGTVTAIVLMRWGPYAALHAVLGGLVFSLASHGNLQQIAIYCIGNLFSMFLLIPRRLLGPENIRKDGVISVCFGLGTLLMMQAGRALVALCLGNGLSKCLGFFTTDTLSLLFVGVVVWIARRLDGIFEDQKHYILRINKAED